MLQFRAGVAVGRLQLRRGPEAGGAVSMSHPRMFDVAITYAGEDAEKSQALRDALKRRGLAVFYAPDEKARLTGSNLYTELSRIYLDEAEYCVVLISAHYAKKPWTNRERDVFQARAQRDGDACIVPVRLDSTPLPGLLPTVAYLSWPPETAETIADMLWERFYMHPRTSALMVSDAWSGIRDLMLDKRLDDKARRWYLFMNIGAGMERRVQEIGAEHLRTTTDYARTLLVKPRTDDVARQLKEIKERLDFLDRRRAEIQAEADAVRSHVQAEIARGGQE